MSEVSQAIRLNIGGGKTVIDGFTNVDRKGGQEAFPLAYADNSVDEIRASHILEHFPIRQTEDVIKEWVRVLKPGGRLRIAVPDLVKIGETLTGARKCPFNPLFLAYGGQTDDNDFHKTGFDFGGLHITLQRAGLVGIQEWTSDIEGEAANLPISLNLEGYKPTATLQQFAKKVHVAMSMGRLCFSDTVRCIEQSLLRLGVPAEMHTGAFWNQCLERAFETIVEKAKASGREWILAIDHDTAFTENELVRLFMLADAHPEIDALAPLQPKRNDGAPLLNKDGPLTSKDSIGPLIEAKMAHFGLTLIRVSALEKMAKPWFWGQPNKDGKWGEGRVDDDVYFWNKFVEAGNKLLVASRVCVGHIQLVVSWTTETLGVHHQYVNDFHENGPPTERRH